MSDSMRRRSTSSSVVQIRGMEDVRAKLELLGGRLATNVVRRGLNAGAAVIRKEARERAPVRKRKDGTPAKGSGMLKKGVLSETRGYGWTTPDAQGRRQPTEHRAVVFISKKKKGGRSPRAYARFVELGTKPHAVGKGSIRAVFARSTRRVRQVGGRHPGTKAQPFMSTAFRVKRQQALEVTIRTIRVETDRELRRLAVRQLARGRAELRITVGSGT